MPRGFWDWGVNPTGVVVVPLIGEAELAARLGSISTFDRRGEVLFADNFSVTLNRWITDAIGIGASVALSTARSRSPAYSVLLTGGSDDLGIASIEHAQPFPVLTTFGLEWSFALGSTISDHYVIITLYDGVNVTTYELHWNDVTNQLQYLDSAGNLQVLASSVVPSAFATLFHSAKLVIDATKSQYVRLILDNVTYSMSGIAANVAANTTLASMRILIALVSRAGFNDTVYIDDFILTQNEP